MSALKLTVTGIPGIKAKLDRLSTELRTKTLRRAVRAGGLVYREAARARAPRRSGNLARRILTRTTGEGDFVVSQTGWSRKAFYGLFLEKGTATRERFRSGGGATGRMQARWWLKAVADEKRESAEQTVVRIIKREADRIAGG